MTSTEKKQQAISQILREQIDEEKSVRFRVSGRSMEPFILFNDQVAINKISGDRLYPGDIILFELGNTYCTHRYIKQVKNNSKILYITKGDGFKAFDSPISEDRIIGKVKTIEREKLQIDLTERKYQVLNRVLGIFFRVQWHLYKISKSLINLIVQKKHNPVIQLIINIFYLPFKIGYKILNRIFAFKNF